MLDAVVDFLDQCELAPGVYRTAVRLARLTEPGARYVRVSHEEMAALCGSESENTVRGHLATLVKAGLLTYKRNHAVHVMWADAVIGGRSIRAVGDQIDRTEITAEDTADDGARGGRSIRAVGDHDEPKDEKIDLTARDTRGGRSIRAVGDHPNIGRLVGRSVGGSIPTNQPGGVRGDEPQTATALTDDQRRTVALLTDPEVGMDAVTATKLAQRYSFGFVRANVFAVLEDMRAGKVQKIYVLPSRLSRGGMPRITETDRTTALWKRHCLAEDEAAVADELRRRYIPPEYEDIIIG